MSAHTPGPWKLETESRSSDGSGLLVTTSDGAWNVADCRDHNGLGVDSVEEAEANARLIAAAPALVEALLAYEGALGQVQASVLQRLLEWKAFREAAKKSIAALKQAGAL